MNNNLQCFRDRRGRGRIVLNVLRSI